MKGRIRLFEGKVVELQRSETKKADKLSSMTDMLNDIYNMGWIERLFSWKGVKRAIGELILSLVLVTSLLSCDYPYQYGCRDYYESSPLTYSGDVFYAEKLFGTWQVDYGLFFGREEVKQVRFFRDGKCDVVLEETSYGAWRTVSFSYSYYRNQILFRGNGSSHSLTIHGYAFPELYLWDSFGRYTFRKVRSDGC